MARSLAYRKPRYQIPPRAFTALLQLSRRKRRTATHVLTIVGQWSVDWGTDGRVSEPDLRAIHDFCEWRIMEGYVADLVSVGVLVDLGGGYYVMPHFHDVNVPAWMQARAIAARRKTDALRSQRYRDRRRALGESPNASAAKSRPYPPRHADTYVSIVEPDPITYKAQPSSEIGKPVASQKEALRAQLRQALERGNIGEVNRLALELEALCEPPKAAAAATAQKRSQRALGPARMPKTQRPLHEGDVAAAAKQLRLEPSVVPGLHAELARMGATDADVGYALWHMAKKPPGKVGRRDRYLVGIIRRQHERRDLAPMRRVV